MAKAFSLVLLVVALASAGCTKPYDKDPQGGDEGEVPSCTPGVDGCPCPEDTRNLEAGGCETYDSMVFQVQMEGDGAYEVDVPYPHGLWCLTGNDWLDGMQETKNLDEHTVQSDDRGEVLRLSGRDASNYLARIDLSNRSECATLRADPWSIDPDPAEGTVEVESEEAVTFNVFVRTARGGCAELHQYGGAAEGGWTTLTQTFNATSCLDDSKP